MEIKNCGNNILIMNIIMHMLILFTILNIFFNKFVKVITTKIINKELVHSINNAFDNNQDKLQQYKKFTGSPVFNRYYYYYKNLFQEDDNERSYINETIIENINMFNITLGVIFFLFVIFSFYYKLIDRDNFIKLLLENGLTFIGVGLVEYYFFTQVAIKYIPVEPSYIFSSFLDNIKKKLIK
jgi:hypothetical protein